MRFPGICLLTCGLLCSAHHLNSGALSRPALQQFHQEVSVRFPLGKTVSAAAVQLLDLALDGTPRILIEGQWMSLRPDQWVPLPELRNTSPSGFVLPDNDGRPLRLAVPWREVRQVVRRPDGLWLTTTNRIFRVLDGEARPLPWKTSGDVHQIAVDRSGTLYTASSSGLFQLADGRCDRLDVRDDGGRAWAAADVPGVAVDEKGQLWLATGAGVACRKDTGWVFFEGRDGLPWNDFTGAAAGPGGVVWFGTHLGAVRLDEHGWHYRQGPRWLPDDDIRQSAVDANGTAWFLTAAGVGCIERRPMTLAQKAEHYEREITNHIKRTPFGYVAEAPLRVIADKTTAQPHDSDNDGLWTAMYGAGECFAYAATKDARAKERARQAFEALRFLQVVTQGGEHSPPHGFIARTIRSVEDPDPNVGRLEGDRQAQHQDRLWKVYEPRWPRSADGKWFWKSDTSSDELDGHYFFYPLYYDFCAETEAERERVREVVRGVTDHLLEHGFVLIDHDGRPTRWAIFGPQFLNRDPDWWPERGLNSLSALSYLTVAGHITGDTKYAAAARELIDRHGYAQNAMYPKVQQGPGSGNQSDDEMAFMCFYSLLRLSPNEELKEMIRMSFLRYWVNEAPEMNPFFNFAYASQCEGAEGSNAFGAISLAPWGDWLADAVATLYGFPLDRLNWPHRNAHRLDIQPLGPHAARDVYEIGRGGRGYRVNGKVLPVENRHFNHWNTDPWQLDYGGQGNVLASGTVFLLPYYMGLYHGYIQTP